jgi:GntR family transcriptional repressor for pyruvate dehydrogenase complex
MSDNQEIRFARLERAPAYKNVSEAILKDIIDGRLTVGNRLPSEQKLAEQFGVRRSTVARRHSPARGNRSFTA